MREPSWSLVPTAKCGLRSVGDCHQSVFRRPPPPRLVGVNVALGWAWARPAEASIWAARGAVSPSATIVCTKRRRLRLPAFTAPTRTLSSCSSMGFLLSGLPVPVGETPERGVPAGEIHATQPHARGRHPVPPEDRDDHDVLDDEIVHLDEERRALHRVELGVRRLVGPVVLLVAPPRDVAPLPLVGFRGDLPG